MVSDSFIADLHIHSKFSRATARNLDLENIYVWAQLKGIGVVGTGDFTHPEWFFQITEKLEPAEPGLYRLKSDISRSCDERVPPACRAPVRFMLSCEISNIYKKKDRTRKNHNLVFFPELKQVQRFNARLDAIGNINADGRPILGLDARDLLEIVLETSDEGFLVPAHIWTPWFSMLGSKSGFDSIEACFDDLSSHIFAAETGLSSDPSMNWRVAELDNITLISNSDAHSPAKLGREANLFKTEMNYYAMRSAMERGDKNQFAGTFEFYPEEGKYHVDGHRKCEVCLTPAETQSLQGICPVCAKPLTLGVLHRVEVLATRPEGARPERAFPFHRLIPLDDLLSEILRVGTQSKKVKRAYRELMQKLGNEFNILHYLDRDTIETAGVPLLAEAIERMRDNRVSFSPGYDGLFGTVKIFTDRERKQLLGQRSLFSTFDKKVASADTDKRPKSSPIFKQSTHSGVQVQETGKPEIQLNREQQAAVDHPDGPLMIIAGPGTGKTRTLTQKIARLMQSGLEGERLMAVTFTNKAAGEMKDRLRNLVGPRRKLPFVGTFHALGYRILSRSMAHPRLAVVDEKTRRSLIKDALAIRGLSRKDVGGNTDAVMAWMVAAKQQMLSSGDDLSQICPQPHTAAFIRCYETYQRLLRINDLADFEDLIFRTVQLLQEAAAVRDRYMGRFSHLFVDEYQDINAGQYRLIRLLAGRHANICIIGDPDQAIYGFRGSDAASFKWFHKDYADTRTLFLRRNYRSTQTILEISSQVIGHNPDGLESGRRRTVYSNLTGGRTIQLLSMATENGEAVGIGKRIETMVGGTGFFSIDSGAVDSSIVRDPLSFADFAVLFRTRNQGKAISRALEKVGIPCQLVDRQTLLNHPGIETLISVFKLVNRLGVFVDIQVAGRVIKPSVSTRVLEILKSWAYQKNLSLAQALVQARRLPIPHMGRARQQQLYNFTGKIIELQHEVDDRPVAETLEWIGDRCGLRQKYAQDPIFEAGYRQILETGKAHRTDFAGFMATVALSSNTDIYDHRVEKVALMTMHAAKGLEFPVVFIAGCEDGYIPYGSTNRPSDPQEERRLFYVALTRAKRHLFLTRAEHRRINGQMQFRQWSPFVKEIENSYKQICAQSNKQTDQPARQQLALF